MSRDSKLSLPGAEVALYDGRAIEIGYSEGVMIYGLSEDLRSITSLPKCDEIHLTRVHKELGDTVFDEIN